MIVSVVGGALALVGALALGRLRRRWLVVDVHGRSMEPTLRDGDRVLVRRIPARALRRGQLVVLGASARLGTERLVKRLVAVTGDPVPAQVRRSVNAGDGDRVPAGKLVVIGDNAAHGSVDSRQLGYFDTDQFIGVVIRPINGRPASGG
jgi:signal peptidase I